MDYFAYIMPWVFASVGIGIAAGFFLGRARPSRQEDEELLQQQRQSTLKVLVELLDTAEKMSSTVECHNTEIQETAEEVGNLATNGHMESVKQALLGHMATLLESNQTLKKDLVCSRYHIEEQAQEIDEVRREARTDTLTTVANRKAFDEKLHLLTAGWKRDVQPFVLILIDLDYFKRINDSHGHQAGDRVLGKVGQWLKEWVREGDFIGRYGGDEFAILLPRTELAVGLDIAETIRSRTAERASRVALRSEQVSVSFSIGVAAPRAGDTLESILDRADAALYRSKRLGRNRVQAEAPEGEKPPTPIPDTPVSLPGQPLDDRQMPPGALV